MTSHADLSIRGVSVRPAGWMIRRRPGVAAALVPVATSALLHLGGCTKATEGPTESTSLSVNTTVARVQPTPILVQDLGQAVPEHSVQVRPQVTGMLTQVFFPEGRAVTAGQRLFRIEPAPFAAALRAAEAVAQSAQANADRAQSLVKPGYISQQDYRNVLSAAEQAAAAYTQAEINLSYTDIRAPISGRTGSLTVKSGNVVSPADPAPLVTINQMKPIQVQFSVPQQILPQVRRYQAEGRIKVTAAADDGGGVLDTGELVFIDNSVNAGAGTVTLKAQFPNDREQLWPGQYVGVTLELAVEPKAVVVEDTTIQVGQHGRFVYLVVHGKAVAQDITVDRQVGDLAVVSSGLHGGERIVSRVPRGLRSGTPVAPAPATPEVTLPESR
jgi:multidrug efflux system membrane fusion protein